MIMYRCLSIAIIGYITERFCSLHSFCSVDGTQVKYVQKYCDYVCLADCDPVRAHAYLNNVCSLFVDDWINAHKTQTHTLARTQCMKRQLHKNFAFIFLFCFARSCYCWCCCCCRRLVKRYFRSIDWTPVRFAASFFVRLLCCFALTPYLFPFFWLLFVFTPHRSNFQKLTNSFSSLPFRFEMHVCRQYTPLMALMEWRFFLFLNKFIQFFFFFLVEKLKIHADLFSSLSLLQSLFL